MENLFQTIAEDYAASETDAFPQYESLDLGGEEEDQPVPPPPQPCGC